jgi:HlyD family secretion protein
MSRRTILALAAFAALLVAVLAWWALRAPLVAALTVQPAPLVRTLLFSARVATASRVDVGSTLTGRVLEVAVDEGAQVRRGDVLVRLESDELRAALDQAQASERQAAARLAGLRSSGRSAAQAAVAQAESVLQAARAELQRTQDLVARDFLSQSRLDDARRAVDVAQAQLAGARAQLAANAEQGTDVAQAQAQLALARAAVAATQARLEQAVVTSPADARVLVRAVEPGQIVQPGRALLTLALAGPLQLVGQVDERYLEQLQIGQPASVLADAFPGRSFAARVQAIAPVVDAQRGSIEVKLALPQAPPDFLREDMTLSVEVETGRRERTLVVPMAALDGGHGGSAATVHVVHDGRVEARALRLGLRTLEAAEVLEGLAAGDVVLLGPAPEPGRRVRPDTGAAAQRQARLSREDAGSAMMNTMGR